MKIVTNSRTEFVVDDFPAVFAGVVALIFAASTWILIRDWSGFSMTERIILGGWCALLPLTLEFAANRTRLRLDKTSNRVELIRRGLLRRARETFPLDRLERAKLQALWSDDTKSYRLILEFDRSQPLYADPAVERRRQWRSRTGFRLVPAHQMPVTSFYSDEGQPRAVADAINAWL